MAKILVGCEFSGTVRDAFIAEGHEATSCDLLPTETPGPHIIGNILDVIKWFEADLFIVHPPCTRLANSGVRWLHERNLWDDMREAAQFFRSLFDAPYPRVMAENPIPHKYAREIMGDYTQIIQPWQFGHGETKATCLWLRNLPPLVPTDVVDGREGRVWKASPGPDRWKIRSRFYPGIAKAMAQQWGSLL